MNYGIIYCAYNKINQKRYIGQTIQRLSERKVAHYSKDKEIYFHKALHKYAEDDWEWCVDISLFPNAIYCKELDKIYLNYNDAQKQDHFSGTYLGRAFKTQGSPCIYAGYTFYKINE